MKKSRFSAEEIIRLWKQHEGQMKTADVCLEHGISAEFGGMDVAGAHRLKQLKTKIVI